ncbi:hypothetical protein [Streptomyces huiliensis]|uniref:hypothetical protein n=1 Tax=Streptomyces huiliensis TaxID=2876027 RepID=UPI001CBD77F4|nr:hypothetical protein [Streptomyces huiliensis]MBZ4319325.1 hypothetical protein [Streptomyces huiliensis]
MRNVLLMAAGAVVIVLTILLMFFWHQWLLDLAGNPRFAAGLAGRAAEAGALYGGTWLCVRGWNGRNGRRAA